MMLNWFINYCNYYDYYFYDNYNYFNINQNYNSPVPQLTRNINVKSMIKNGCGGGNNQKKIEKAESPNSKTIEAANIKKGVEAKIEQGNNKGCNILLKMDNQHGQGLGKIGVGKMEPVGIVNNSDGNGLATSEENTKNVQVGYLSKSQRKKRRRRERKEADIARELAAEKAKTLAQKTVEAAEIIEKQSDNNKAGEKVNNKMEGAKESTTLAKSNNDNFTKNDSGTPQFLRALASCFQSEIKLMQLQLKEAAPRYPPHNDGEYIVAKIFIGQNQTVPENAFEYIRTDLIGWIGAYQREGMDTPIFHCMTNNCSHIIVVCDNEYAYKCLVQCIDDITQTKNTSSIKLVRQPYITPFVYCFDAVYEGIANDSALFLNQIHLHKSKLYSDTWIVVSHEVYPKEGKTNFIFLIDDRSAMALNFYYSRNFFICLQKVTFSYRGIITDEYLK